MMSVLTTRTRNREDSVDVGGNGLECLIILEHFERNTFFFVMDDGEVEKAPGQDCYDYGCQQQCQ